MTASIEKSMLLILALTSWSVLGLGASAARAQGYARQSPLAYYYPSPGHYNTTSGMVWVPAPGYYHVVPLYFYPAGSTYPRTVTVWQAHPAPPPANYPVSPRGKMSGQVHAEWYWHGKNITTEYAHEAWIRRQQAQLKGR